LALFASGLSIVVVVTTASGRDFFLASASVAGALIGLLFVAVSVASERVLGPEASDVHGVRAAATLAAFTNALTVSLFGLVPGFNVGGAATVVAIVGLLFIAGALMQLAPAWRAKRIGPRDLTFLLALLVVFVIQLIAGVELDRHTNDGSDLQTICVLVIVCFLIGIARAWDLVGGPNIYLVHQLLKRRQTRRRPDDGSDRLDDR
jgi:MFS family permease